MRSTRILAVAVAAAAGSIGCGGSRGADAPPRLSHPVLDRDYADQFAGPWTGRGTFTANGQSQTTDGVQSISRVGFNRLGIAEMCPGVDGAAGLDSPSAFSVDPLVCAPIAEPCGPVTISYKAGTGQLSQGTLTLAIEGTAAGCGQSFDFTMTFTGRLPVTTQPAMPPAVAVASDSVTAIATVPVGLDASASTDPDGHALQFSWRIASEPSGGDGVLGDAATATPSFTATVAGVYRVEVTVTSWRGLSATKAVSITVVPIAPTQSFVLLQSDAGDYIGGGQTYRYTNAVARISVSPSGGHLGLSIVGDQSWTGDFQLPSGAGQLMPGTYANVTRYPFNDPATGGLSWWGEGRGCNTLTGWFVVDGVTYAGSTLTSIDLRFEQHCEGGTPALHGRVHWTAGDTTSPPGPVVPPPAGLWQPAAGATPATGNYVYLQSDAGDYIGAGQGYTYTQATAVLNITASGGHLGVRVTGDQDWGGDFQGMSTLTQLQPGYYGNLERYPFNNPVTGGLSWSGEGRGCNTLTGWFVVDGVTYAGGTLTSIDLRFEQHCEGGTPALHGQVHWAAGDTTSPPGPVVPPPAGLWQPAAGATPATGNYVYLQSDGGDYIGAGQGYTYTQANAVLNVTASGGRLGVTVTGDQDWWGNFQVMNSLTQLQPGYYGNLERYPFNNPVTGGLDWYGEGRGCNTLTGWFVVDGVTYAGSTLTSIDLRFEQHCEGGTPALHGQVHWAAGDTTSPPGPVVPPPAGLWQPAVGATPATGNYVYLQSDAGDYIGAGQAYTYTQATAALSVTASGGHLGVTVTGGQDWGGDFQVMNSLTQLQVGYYGNLERYPFNNPVTGGLSWSGEGRGCNTLTGWFAVDGVTYAGSALTSIDLRFEQHCEGGGPALHGQVRWQAP